MCCSLIMKVLVVFSCLLVVVAGFYSRFAGGGHYPPGVFSKRQEDYRPVSRFTPGKLCNLLINNTLEDATRGISGGNLSSAAQSIQYVAKWVLGDRQVNVSRDDVVSLVSDTQAQLGLQSCTSNILDDALTTEARNIDIELKLLQALCVHSNSIEEEGQSQDVTVAAIKAVGQALEHSVSRTEGIIWFITAASQQSEGDGDDGDDGADGNNEEKRALEKRQKSLEFGGGYESGKGWNGHVNFTYKWRR